MFSAAALHTARCKALGPGCSRAAPGPTAAAPAGELGVPAALLHGAQSPGSLNWPPLRWSARAPLGGWNRQELLERMVTGPRGAEHQDSPTSGWFYFAANPEGHARGFTESLLYVLSKLEKWECAL